ncbi:MAG: DUF3198 domain-containing protein [Thermoplasmata archaeon]|nr:DUF3198 domain-containing protein [Candidatus Sysuiplasma acidicola]MBX8637550.1 DUF3198 domain-containing protein [Candidatus Sysuiplasma acidicola]MBX8645158.1 DUF3198 domain-containing protein [Candidatus Sysuiplasma acidicola]MDH2906122.1 DUF3198 domain-containing protein [Methanomassiliicoccales archaeon]
MAKAFTREFRFELSVLMLAIGVVITFVSALGLFVPKLPAYLLGFQPAIKAIGSWLYWLLVIGPIMLVGGLWWFVDSVKKTFELMKYLKVDSKAKFVKNLEEIEYLAWVLPRKYEDMVIDKKRQFKI